MEINNIQIRCKKHPEVKIKYMCSLLHCEQPVFVCLDCTFEDQTDQRAEHQSKHRKQFMSVESFANQIQSQYNQIYGDGENLNADTINQTLLFTIESSKIQINNLFENILLKVNSLKENIISQLENLSNVRLLKSVLPSLKKADDIITLLLSIDQDEIPKLKKDLNNILNKKKINIENINAEFDKRAKTWIKDLEDLSTKLNVLNRQISNQENMLELFEEQKKESTQLLTYCLNGSLKMIDLNKYTVQSELQLKASQTNSFGISTKLGLVAIGNMQSPYEIMIYDFNQKKLVGELKGHTNNCQLFPLVFIEDERKILSASSDNTIRVWNLETFTQDIQFNSGFSPAYNLIRISNTSFIACSGKCLTGYEIKLIDMNDQTQSKTFIGHSGFIYSLQWSTSQGQIISSSDDSTVRFWDINTVQCTSIINLAVQGCGVFVLDEQDKFLVGLYNGSISCYSLISKQQLFNLKGHDQGHLLCIDYDPTKDLLVSGSNDKTVCFWKLNEQKMIKKVTNFPNLVRGLKLL